MAAMKLWTLLVPTISNEGKPYRTRFHKVWDCKVRAITGGLTILSPIKGQWACDGVIYTERMIPVLIGCTEEQIETIANLTAKYYNQLAVCYWKTSEQFVVKHYTKKVKHEEQNVN